MLDILSLTTINPDILSRHIFGLTPLWHWLGGCQGGTMVSIVVVDDHPIIRRGLKSLLETQADFQVVGETGSGFEAVQMIERLQPNIVLLDLMLDGISGIEVARRIATNSAGSRVIIFSVLDSERHVLEALRTGVKGYVLKQSPAEELILAIREVAIGKRYLCSTLQKQPYIQQKLLEGYAPPDMFSRLTAREREVLQFSVQGTTCAEIARQLKISRRTVEAHRANMMRKLGLSSATALYHYAFQQDYLLNR